jgi:hypothetical protein
MLNVDEETDWRFGHLAGASPQCTLRFAMNSAPALRGLSCRSVTAG